MFLDPGYICQRKADSELDRFVVKAGEDGVLLYSKKLEDFSEECKVILTRDLRIRKHYLHIVNIFKFLKDFYTLFDLNAYHLRS